jgi:excisionase family DNA binding protein
MDDCILESINDYLSEWKMTVNDSSKTVAMETEYRENKLPARLLPINEVARFLGVHSSTVRRWEKTGLLKSYAIGLRHNLRFKQEDVLNFLDKSRENSTRGVSLNSLPDTGRHRTKTKGKSV